MALLPAAFTPGPAPFAGLPDLPAIEELRQHRQWVAWKIEIRNGRPTKPPVSPLTGYGASHSSSGTWGTYEQAVQRAADDGLPGVGFVISDKDEFTGADLDKCRNAETGELEAWAAAVLALAETYAEISPSGTGIRLIWRGKVAETIKCDPAHVEVYRSLRYLTITGRHIAGTPEDIRPAQLTEAALRARVEQFRPPAPKLNGSVNGANFFRSVNDKALANLASWVPSLFGAAARFQFGTGAYRISSQALGRNLEEDLSISPRGIKDWGVHDIGDGRLGSRSPIDLAMEYGVASDVMSAAQWLCDRLGRTPADLGFRSGHDPVAVVSQSNLAKLVPLPASPEPERLPAKPALDTSDLSDLAFPSNPYLPEACPGIIGEVIAHILETALFPVPDFAALSAIVFASALYGRRWAEPIMAGGLNVYAIATAPTGWGKDHPLQEPRQIAYRCEMMHMMGPGEFKSDSAIEKVLRKCPIRASYMDEIGIVLQANSGRNASAWEKRVRKALLEVYSASKGMWTGSQAAGDKDEKDKGSEPLHRPILSLYGTSTPEELYKGLTDDNVRDGLFGRLIFAAPDRKPSRQRPGPGDYDRLRAQIDAIRSFTPTEVPEKQRALYHSNLRNALVLPAVIRAQIDGEGRAALETIDDWQRELTEKEGDLTTIANRAAENTGKLATLRALSRDHTSPVVALDDVQWGWTIVERSLFVIARDIERHMVGSEFEGLVKAIRRYLEDAGKDGMKYAELLRRKGVSKFHARDISAAIKQMQDAEELVFERTNRGARVRMA